LRNGGALARANRKIAVIGKEANRLEQVLNSFLRYAGKIELQTSGVGLNELVGDMVDFYLLQGQSSSITVRLSLYNKPLICRIDVYMLKQAILNLFLNAQQAMNEGGELIIGTARERTNAVIRISDTGVGIAPDILFVQTAGQWFGFADSQKDCPGTQRYNNCRQSTGQRNVVYDKDTP